MINANPLPAFATDAFQGQVAIITGAASPQGIGFAAARLLASCGARAVIMTDIAPEITNSAAVISAELGLGSTAVLGRVVDATSESDMQNVINFVLSEFHRLDIFVANAGVVSLSSLPATSLDKFMQTYKVNAGSAFLGIKYATPAMKATSASKPKSCGSIICVSSVAGLRSGAGPADYSAAKAAVSSLVQTTCNELAGTDIRVNAICPGLIETGMTQPLFELARARGTAQLIGQLNSLKRAGTAAEVANVIAFLASRAASSYINGQSITVDGGLSSSLPVASKAKL